MSLIYDVTSTLTQMALDAFCQKYHIPDTVHPELPGLNQNVRNCPAGKIGVYTSFFWVDASVFPSSIPWYTKKTLARDPSPTAAEFSAEACDFLATHPAPFRKFPERFLCLVGLSRYYDLDDNVYLPSWLIPEKRWIYLLLFVMQTLPRLGSVVRVDHGGQNDNIENLNEGSGDDDQENHFEGSDRAGQDEAVTIVMDEGFRATAADKNKSKKKKRRAAGASDSVHPTKKLREDHDTSSDAGAKCEGDGNTDSVSGTNLRIQRPSERSVIFSDSSHHSSTNTPDAEVTFIVRSPVSPPSLMAVAVTTTVVAGTSSALARQGQMLQIYVPKWNVVNESVLDDPDVCRNVIDQLAPLGLFSQLRSMDYDQLFAESNVGVAHQACLSAEVDLLKEKDVEIANLKAQSPLKEAEATEAINLRNQVSVVEVAGKSRQFASLETQRDGFVDQVSLLETTCFGLHDQVSGYELFKEQCEAIQDEQVKALSDRVVGLDSELMALALHLDEEFYPHFLTIIAGWRWIIGHGLRLAVMKCHQSPKYGAPFVAVIGLAIDKGIQAGLVAGIDHGKVRRVLLMLLLTTLPWKRGPSAETLEKLKEGALSHRLSISGAMGVLADPLSFENLIGEASTSGVPVMAVATTALAISVTAANISSISPISVADYDMPGAGVQDTAPHSPKIMFEKEDLETTPEHPSAS
ncbi:hypothetical protein Tco_1205663 [Tanacetum coccineum]